MRTKAEEAMAQKGFITVAKAATLAKHTSSTIYRWIEDGKVDGTTAAGTQYVNEKSLREYLGPLAEDG